MKQRVWIVLGLLVAACSTASAQRTYSVGGMIGLYLPSSSFPKDTFGDVWPRFSLGVFEKTQNEQWRLSFALDYLEQDDEGEARLIPITVGLARGFGRNPKSVPFVAVRAGTFYGKVEQEAAGIDETRWGFNGNISFGVILNQKWLFEARYDYFSRISGFNFDGLTFSAGYRLFDFRM